MRTIVNAVSAKMGGAVAYMRNFLPTLARLDAGNEYVVFLQPFLAGDFASLSPNIRIESWPPSDASTASRLIFDQWTLRRRAKHEHADCIFSTANFGVLRPGLPQVTSVRNPVYFCRDYYRHVRRIEGRLAVARVGMRRRMVALSAASSAAVVTPTAAMREMLLEWRAAEAAKCVVIHHGFDRERFLSMRAENDGELDGLLGRRGNEVVLFYPSLYGKHKNFDTLVEAVAELASRGMNVRLLLTCRIDPAADPYQRRTAALINERGIAGRITMLGRRPYAAMPRIYRAADVVVWPTFAESFGHPLLEAMACGRPIVSSDLPVNREMARDAALYFDTFDPADFADKVEKALDPAVSGALVAGGTARTGDFSWERHVSAFIDVFKEVSERGNG